MSETILLWIFGGIGAWLVALSAAYIKAWTLVVEMRATLLVVSKEAAKILHSPTDHLGLDRLLDKYVKREHELTFDEWRQLFQRCTEIINDPLIGNDERLLALFVKELSVHKQKNRSHNPPL